LNTMTLGTARLTLGGSTGTRGRNPPTGGSDAQSTTTSQAHRSPDEGVMPAPGGVVKKRVAEIEGVMKGAQCVQPHIVHINSNSTRSLGDPRSF
jgi:hypothetical protein